MTTDSTKPPWRSIEWYKTPTKISKEDEPRMGEWSEYVDADITFLKEQIHPYDKTELWDLAKRITNSYELISTFSNRLKLPKPTCCFHPLSRSFFKMIEIMHHLQFFERHKHAKYKSLHVCEGPGGFIQAFHYLAESNRKRVQASYAMTLKSTHSMIPGWRRAANFLQKHDNIHLLYGPNRTGDIYEIENQAACLDAVGLGVQLATADGGFDFSDDFINQEKNILRLLVNSAIILLECVAIEGDIVLKIFDCNSSATRDLVYILSTCFQSWTLYKPTTSRPCNSEWYFLGKSANRDRKNAIELLKKVRDEFIKDGNASFIRLTQTNPIEDHVFTLQQQRCKKQTDALKSVIAFCKESDKLDHAQLWEFQREKTVKWCYEFKMPTEFKI